MTAQASYVVELYNNTRSINMCQIEKENFTTREIEVNNVE